MTQEKSQKPVAHLYAFALVWLFFAILGYKIFSFYNIMVIAVFAFTVSLIVYLISFAIRKFRKRGENIGLTPVMQSVRTGNSELDTVITESQLLIRELTAAKRKIQSPAIVRTTDEIIDISHKIIEKLQRQPQLFSSARRFFNYYLPTTTNLITNYSYMESQGISGGNISSAMQKIEGSLTTLANAYRTQLDTLFSHTAIDLETDIAALEQILKQEGLL